MKMRNRRLRRRLERATARRLLPSVITVVGLCAGFTSIRFALEGDWRSAILAIMVAGVLDLLDGAVARIFTARSDFGAELDSLADLVSFGIAPAIVIYLWSMNGAGSVGWVPVVLFAACAALRLARFNSSLGDQAGSVSKTFVGVPTPAAASIVLLPVLLGNAFGPWPFDSIALNGAALIAGSLLMVSKVPTLSFKMLRITNRLVLPTLVLVCLLTAFLVTAFWITASALAFAYIVSLPIGIVILRNRPAVQHQTEAAAEAPVPADGGNVTPLDRDRAGRG